MMKTYLAIIVSLSMLFMTACEKETVKKPKGELELNSVPQGADIILNSTLKLNNQTPVNVKPAPGTYLVKMTKKGRQSAWQYVKIKANKKTRLTLSLPPIRGSVLITSHPVGGKVTMDGKAQGLTPLILTDLKPGEYSAQIDHINRAPRVVKWKITDMRPKKISAALDSDIGKLILKTIPPKARIYINGKAVGLTPFRTDLQEGMHKIRVTLNGFADVKTTVDIAREKETAKSITMVRLPGTLTFKSNPTGAQVYINQRNYGTTPLTVPDLQSGKYKIRVGKNGFDSISRDAYVTAGRENVVEFTLKRNTGGIDLIVNPPGVTVYVNGKKRGMTVQGESKDLSKVIHIRNLPAGKYQIMLAHKRMQPPTMKKYVRVKKAKITRPKPINVWIANAVLKVKDEAEIHVLLYVKNKNNIIYSPEPGVKIRKKVLEIDFVRPLTEQDQ
jgi:PEGA domain